MRAFILFLCLAVASIEAFAPLQPTANTSPLLQTSTLTTKSPFYADATTKATITSSTSLQALPAALTSAAARVSPLTAAVAVCTAFTLQAVYRRRKFLFATDPAYQEPLPEGQYGGCPLIGSNLILKSKSNGLTNLLFPMSKKLGHPGIYKLLTFGRPMAVVSGGANVRKVLSQEFKEGGVGTGGLPRSSEMLGENSIISSQEDDEHNYLRALIGQSMTPEAITKAVPTLHALVEKSLDTMSLTEPTTMETLCTDFTLDVAHGQILGLDLSPDEIPEFRAKVNQWILGSFSPRTLFMPFWKQSKAWKARLYLVDKIERKIEQLERDGPDGSTISAMVYAQYEEDTSKRLTRGQIIDNALILILAGTETAASTLTNMMLFFGLHPDVYQKIVDEQKQVIQERGETISRSILDRYCPYMDAVVKETMRIRPISSGAARVTKGTMVIDGKQIPKGWPITPSVEMTHMLDPTVYQDDLSHMDAIKGFQPERWLDPKTRPGADWVAFGWGPRYCLGASLALAEMKVFLAVFARRFAKVELANQGEVVWKRLSIIPKPKDGSVVKVTPMVESALKKETAEA